MINEPLEALLYRALTTPLGIVVECHETDGPQRLRMKLYPLRKAQPEFDPLSFVLSPMNPTQLWIVRKPNGQE